MGMYQPPKYRKKNKETGLWEWVTPPMIEMGVKVYEQRLSRRQKEKNENKLIQS